MSEANHYNNYSRSAIEKYWKGQLSPAEMHAMEKAAQEDPFLADAMDGYEANALQGSNIIEHDIKELSDRLAERVSERKVVPIANFQWWKIAAIVIVLIGGAWLYSTLTNNHPSENIAASDAKQKNSAQVSKDSLPATVSPVMIDSSKEVVAANNKLHAFEKPGSVSISKRLKKIDSNSIASVAEPLANPKELKTVSADKSIAAVEAEKKADLVKSEGEATKLQKNITESDDNKVLAARSSINTFNGTVIDQSKQPVANAIVQIPNLNIVTQTDNKGYFSFKAPDTALSVSIASVGFETQNLKLQNNAGFSNQIILKPATSYLDEVVESGYSTKKKRSINRTKDLTIHILDAEPVISWDDYNKYLEKNKKVPDEFKDIHGYVIIYFTVVDKTTLKNFSIAKSLQDSLDNEAIRLIKEGPSWRLLKGKKAKVSVMVKF